MQVSFFVSVLAAGSDLCSRAVPPAASHEQKRMDAIFPVGVQVTLWASATEIRSAQKGKQKNAVSTVNAWFNRPKLSMFQIPVSVFMM